MREFNRILQGVSLRRSDGAGMAVASEVVASSGNSERAELQDDCPRRDSWNTLAHMLRFIRFLGVLNAGLWLGAILFGTICVLPLLFSPIVTPGLIPKYHAGAIAQLILKRYFYLQIACSMVALGHGFWDQWYSGRIMPRGWMRLPWALLVATVLAGAWLQPKMEHLHRTKYATNRSQVERDQAARSFSIWHAFSQIGNLLIAAGVGVYFWNSVQATDASRWSQAPRRFT